jgi:hypothetical protein
MELNKITWQQIEDPNFLPELDKRERLKVRNYILNKEPAENWVKKHPVYGNRYLPIDKIEWLLTVMFGSWRVSIKETKQCVNSIVCTVKLWYWDSVTESYDWQEGVGAEAIQIDKDTAQLKSAGVMIAAPIAESRAISDAADKIGRIFGRDLNRKDLLGYENVTKIDIK